MKNVGLSERHQMENALRRIGHKRRRERKAEIMTKRLLIIDDDPDLCEELVDIFSEEGYLVETAQDGERGLALLNKNAYQVALLDIKLPGMNGIEVLKNLGEGRFQGRIFIISGAPDAQQRIDAAGVSHKVKGIVRKPFDIETMLEAVKD